MARPKKPAEFSATGTDLATANRRAQNLPPGAALPDHVLQDAVTLLLCTGMQNSAIARALGTNTQKIAYIAKKNQDQIGGLDAAKMAGLIGSRFLRLVGMEVAMQNVFLQRFALATAAAARATKLADKPAIMAAHREQQAAAHEVRKTVQVFTDALEAMGVGRAGNNNERGTQSHPSTVATFYRDAVSGEGDPGKLVEELVTISKRQVAKLKALKGELEGVQIETEDLGGEKEV